MRLHEPLLPAFAAVVTGLAIARYQQFPERDIILAAAAIAAAAVIAWLAHSKRLAFTASLIAQTLPDHFEVAAVYPLGELSAAIEHVDRAGKVGTVIVRP